MDTKLFQVVEEIKKNYADLYTEWQHLKQETNREEKAVLMNQKIPKDMVCVYKNDLACLAAEITQLKQTLPMVLNKTHQQSQSSLQELQKENQNLKDQCEKLAKECQKWKSKFNDAVGDVQTEKQECLKLRCEMQNLSQELTQQTEYCSSLGSACCTLLWRVSRAEDSVQAILAGTKVDEFLSLVSSTLQSYISAYSEDWPQERSDENQFILALCGIITIISRQPVHLSMLSWSFCFQYSTQCSFQATGCVPTYPLLKQWSAVREESILLQRLSSRRFRDIAASAYGRDYLVTHKHSQQLIDTYLDVLQQAPLTKSARLKNLIVMCLYNISINKKGVECLTSRGDLLPLLGWLLQGEDDKELRLNTLRLIQSLLFEQTNCSIVHQVAEAVPEHLLADMSKENNAEIRELALELITDLKQVKKIR